MSEGEENSIVGLDECPHCHGKHVFAAAPTLTGDSRREAIRYSCRKCLTSWLAVYRFVSIEDLQVVSEPITATK